MRTESKNESHDLAEALSEAAWQRLRSQALATARYESIVPLQQAIAGKDEAEVSRRGDLDNDYHALAVSFLLLILRELFDPHNAELLRTLGTSENGHTAKDFADVTGRPVLTVQEQISALVQSGFVQKDFDSGKIFLTSEGKTVVNVFEMAITSLAAKIEQLLPEILAKAAK